MQNKLHERSIYDRAITDIEGSYQSILTNSKAIAADTHREIDLSRNQGQQIASNFPTDDYDDVEL